MTTIELRSRIQLLLAREGNVAVLRRVVELLETPPIEAAAANAMVARVMKGEQDLLKGISFTREDLERDTDDLVKS